MTRTQFLETKNKAVVVLFLNMRTLFFIGMEAACYMHTIVFLTRRSTHHGLGAIASS